MVPSLAHAQAVTAATAAQPLTHVPTLRWQDVALPPEHLIERVPVDRISTAAMQLGDIGYDPTAGWSTRARRKAWAPELELGATLREQGAWEAEITPGATYYDTPRILVPLPERGSRQIGTDAGVKLRWDLGEAIYTNEQRLILQERERWLEYREDTLQQVHSAYRGFFMTYMTLWNQAHAPAGPVVLSGVTPPMAIDTLSLKLELQLWANRLDTLTRGEFSRLAGGAR
jgi:hypothetical protein